MVASLPVVAEMKAEFGELAFEFLLAGVEVWVASGGKFLGQFKQASVNGMMIGVVHDLIPFS